MIFPQSGPIRFSIYLVSPLTWVASPNFLALIIHHCEYQDVGASPAKVDRPGCRPNHCLVLECGNTKPGRARIRARSAPGFHPMRLKQTLIRRQKFCRALSSGAVQNPETATPRIPNMVKTNRHFNSLTNPTHNFKNLVGLFPNISG